MSSYLSVCHYRGDVFLAEVRYYFSENFLDTLTILTKEGAYDDRSCLSSPRKEAVGASLPVLLPVLQVADRRGMQFQRAG
jgi:hypothetical protein